MWLHMWSRLLKRALPRHCLWLGGSTCRFFDPPLDPPTLMPLHGEAIGGKARTEEAHNEAVITEDMVVESFTDIKREIETLRCELKDAH
ncbi:hypothetical protein GW17_00057769 [Ensete ventricosum]|nr:hypothetical protein GW17_00057769 [Ensete ventricosum]